VLFPLSGPLLLTLVLIHVSRPTFHRISRSLATRLLYHADLTWVGSNETVVNLGLAVNNRSQSKGPSERPHGPFYTTRVAQLFLETFKTSSMHAYFDPVVSLS
jgi:hypothetical protein